MSRKFDRQQQRNGRGRTTGLLPLTEDMPPQRRPVTRAAPLKAQNGAQGQYIASIHSNTITFGLGPAGVGKTYIAARLAAEALERGDTRRIIVTRPAVEAGESLGFLPGELDEKYAPWLRPVYDVLVEGLGSGHVDYMLKNGDIEALPLAYMRGNTFKDAWVILDEAQNTTPAQMYLFLSRIGEGAKVIVNGDLLQKDIPGPSGLADAISKLKGLVGVSVCQFDADDIVRSGIVREIVRRYETSTRATTRYNDEHDDDDTGLRQMLGA